MANNFQHEREVATAALRRAAAICRSVQSSIAPEALAKKDRSPVTVADFASQAVICRALAEAYPHDPIVAEEDAVALRHPDQRAFLEQVQKELAAVGIDADMSQICDWIDRGDDTGCGDRFWTVDPIDGTKGFLRGEQYAVALALLVEGQVVLGALACPNLSFDGTSGGTLFLAIRGEGAWMQALDEPEKSRPIRVSGTSDLSQARLCESVESSHSAHGWSARMAERVGMTAPPVRLDSQAKYGVVARGEADLYVRLPTRPDYRERIWDHAGGVLLVEEAGGRVTDITGRPLDFTKGTRLVDNRGVLVSNGCLHEAVLEALEELAER